MNCTELDVAVDDVRVLFGESEGGFVVACGALVVASLLLLVMGESWVRPMSAVVAGISAGVVVFVVSAFVEEWMPCVARLVVACVAAVCGAVLALCIFKTGLFVIGAAGFGAVAHLVYESLPMENISPPFVLAGRSGYYYATLTVAGLVGAVVSQFMRTHFVRISSSLLGGGGLALTVHLVATRSDDTVPGIVLLLVLLVSTVGGVGIQYRVARYRRKKREQRHTTVVQGVPVK